MATTPTDTSKQEVCSINILFTVDSDDEAIGYKKKIGDIFSTLPNVQIQFRLVNMPAKGKDNINGYNP